MRKGELKGDGSKAVMEDTVEKVITKEQTKKMEKRRRQKMRFGPLPSEAPGPV